MGQRLTKFFQSYLLGALSYFPDFKASLCEARREHDAPNTTTERFFETLQDGPTFEAPARLKAPSLMTAESMLKHHNRADWQHVDPRIQLFAAKLVEAMRKQGIPLYVHGAFRPRGEQEEMFNRGVSKTRWPRAAHCVGAAVDIVHGQYHWDMTKQEWALLGHVGKLVHHRLQADLPKAQKWAITWGGDWSFYDPAHWEIKGWQDRFVAPDPAGPPVRLTPRRILLEASGIR